MGFQSSVFSLNRLPKLPWGVARFFGDASLNIQSPGGLYGIQSSVFSWNLLPIFQWREGGFNEGSRGLVVSILIFNYPMFFGRAPLKDSSLNYSDSILKY